MFDSRGIPILTLEEKLKALQECINKEHPEDALCHLGDLFNYFLRELNNLYLDHGLALITREKARTVYLDNPSPVIGPNVLERIAKL